MTTIRPKDAPAASSVQAGDTFLIDGATGVRALAASSVATNAKAIVIYADGQSNIGMTPAFVWTPNPRVQIWNNPIDAVATGTAFAALSATTVGVSERFASRVADANPGAPVYLIKNAYTGQSIDRWTGDGVAPAMYVNGTNNLVAALAAAGVSKVDIYLRWQIEADTGALAAGGGYAAKFATMMGRYWGNSYFPKETPMVIMAMASTAIDSDANADAANVILSQIAGALPGTRKFVYTPGDLPDSLYWNTPHMTGQGYFSAGALAANAFLHGARPSTPGTSYDPVANVTTYTGSVAISGASGIALPGGGGISLSGGNVNGAGFFNHVAITQPATSSILTIADGKTFTASNTLTFTGTDGSSVAFGTGGTVLYSGGALGTPASGVATNLTGTAASLTAGSVTTNANLTGDVTSVGNATTLTNAAAIAKVLTGLSASAGTLAATDSILQGFNKLAGLVDNAAWTIYSPTVTSGTGTITTVGTVVAHYKQSGKTVRLQITVPITTAGTGAGALQVTLPVNAIASTFQVGTARDNSTGNVGTSLILTSDATKVSVFGPAGGTFIANGAAVVFSMVYEAA